MNRYGNGFPSRRGNQLNGNNNISDQFDAIVWVPLSQGKPIEWKLSALRSALNCTFVPLSQGKPIEWKQNYF